ncbi:MAG: SDR family NAD(P)-dependent oxidoreductase, partial [Nitrospirae bacterium]
MLLKDKVVFVTGGGQGIGEVISIKCANEGAIVAVGDIDEEKAKGVVKKIEDTGGKAMGLKIDVSKKEDVSAAFEKITSEYNRIDILINNAGITRDALILRMREEDWDAVLDVNLKGAF